MAELLGKLGPRIGVGAIHAILLLGAAAAWFPFLWMVLASLKSNTEIFRYPPTLWPQELQLENLTTLFEEKPFASWNFNSIWIAIVGTLLTLFFSSLAGFGFGKYKFKGRTVLFAVLIGSLIIPFQLILTPLFVVIGKLGWIDNYLALFVPFVAPAFGIFLMKQFMARIPDELLDAARIDGGSEFLIYRIIIVPMVRPGLAALAIFTFLNFWNSFLWPLVVLRSDDHYTLPVGMATFYAVLIRVEYGAIMLGSTLISLPIIVLFLLMQRHFISGLTLGSVRE
ncbi:MAG: carbohydrate ABC transporter permease [Chloroflexi bacterium]|nr:carbohydrate ABC transporter permease [Chloroflexota bacterium]MCY3938621.1 carbohydrate ABC transporter permease [Chloroflexota bacterium]